MVRYRIANPFFAGSNPVGNSNNHTDTERYREYMGIHRTWDESQSPQWRYFQEKESAVKRGNRKTAARLRREESEKINKNENDKWKDINSELKKEYEKNNDDTRSTTQLSTEPKEQRQSRPKYSRIQKNNTGRITRL